MGSLSLGPGRRSRELPVRMGWECVNVRGCRGCLVCRDPELGGAS